MRERGRKNKRERERTREKLERREGERKERERREKERESSFSLLPSKYLGHLWNLVMCRTLWGRDVKQKNRSKRKEKI